MLTILTTHPIQYQTPVWKALAKDGRVPFEVWYLSRHGVEPSLDCGFGKTFAWDIDGLSGYPHRFLDCGPQPRPESFWNCRLREPLRGRLREAGATALWTQGWQVAAYWQAVHEARAAGIPIWLRAESNDLAPVPVWKRPLKRLILGQLFNRIDQFLYIGSANRRLYRHYGVPEARLHPAPYAVDNERFAAQAAALRPQRTALRRNWGIADDAFCILFCGKFVAKKRPMDVVKAAELLMQREARANLHLLFTGSGELGAALRGACQIAYDCDASVATDPNAGGGIKASFAGFLNQTEISRAYVAADCLVLPSDHGETWGLVVNEALASGLPCLVSNACGCTEDLMAAVDPRLTFRCGDIGALADMLLSLRQRAPSPERIGNGLAAHDLARTVATVVSLFGRSARLSNNGTCNLKSANAH
jgi:glycosyltransferase involved in cell wall biosynthesis